MKRERLKRKLIGILSADVVGYSRLMERDEAWTIQSLEENKRLISELIKEYNGRVVDAPGDNLLAEFISVIDAVECAVKIQNELNKKNSNLIEERRMHFRVGVNLGDVVEEEDRIYGNGVNIAARIEGLAEPGGICISRTAYDQVKSKVNVEYDYLGEYQVKNINEPVKVYRILMGGGSTEKYVPHMQSQKRTISIRAAIILCIILIVVAVGITITLLSPKQFESPQVVRFYQELPEDQEIRNVSQPFLAVSPDGKGFVYCTIRGLYLRSINEPDAELIPGTDDRPIDPVFSPDGKWIAYWSQKDSQLKKIALSGGNPVPLADINVVGSLSWNSDNTIMYGFGNTIWRISANGGNPEILFKVERHAIANPQLLPDGNSVIFTNSLGFGFGETILYSLKSGESKVLLRGVSARYVKTGHIVYCMDSDIYAIPFDTDTLELTGGSVGLVDNVLQTGQANPQYALSDSGTLVYFPAATVIAANRNSVPVWVDRTGNEEVLSADPANYRSVRISPDGNKVALTIIEGTNEDIWVLDVSRKNKTQLTFDTALDTFPLWTVDGERIVFVSDQGEFFGLYWKAANGTGVMEHLIDGLFIPSFFTADGEILAVIKPDENKLAISTFSMKELRELGFLLQENYVVTQPKISPDGRWMAYLSGKFGQLEVFVSPFPDVNSGKWKISRDGGYLPLWSPDGKELYYRNGNKVIAVPVETETTFYPGEPEVIFEGTYMPYNQKPVDVATWDIHPSDKRFLMIKPFATNDNEPKNDDSPKINIVLNWFEELKERVPVD